MRAPRACLLLAVLPIAGVSIMSVAASQADATASSSKKLSPGKKAAHKKPSKSKPATASLTVHHTGSLLSVGTFDVVVLAGGPPPTGTTELVDSSGENVASVTQVTSGCAGQPAHHTETGAEAWCLQVSNLGPGSESSGTLKAAKTSLTLTLGGRIGPVAPAVAALISIFLGVLVAWFTGTYLPRAATKVRNTIRRQSLTAQVLYFDGVVVAAALGLGAIAAFSSMATVYAGNATFGTSTDWLALIASGLGSSAATGIVAALVLLKREPVRARTPKPKARGGGDSPAHEGDDDVPQEPSPNA